MSFPPEITRPSGYVEFGGKYATVFTKAVAWEEMVSSNIGGLSESCFHNLTVPSLDAESMTFENGKATARTYIEMQSVYVVVPKLPRLTG